MLRPNLFALAVATVFAGAGTRVGIPSALAPFLGVVNLGKGRRKHRMSGRYTGIKKCASARNSSNSRPHQGAQECARRASGGWARQIKGPFGDWPSFTKNRTIATAALRKAGYAV